MNKIEFYLAAVGIVLGIAIGCVISTYVIKKHDECQYLEQENQQLRQLRDILIEQQDPYRNDTLSVSTDTLTQPNQIDSCDLCCDF